MLRSANYTVMAAAARKAGRALVRDFNEVEHLQVSVKGPGNFVSAADKRAEQIIFNELSKARPDFGFVMEESGEVKGKDASHTFIVDPLDGTTNFLHGIPLFAVSIGLVKDGVPVAGVIYNPIMDELYAAERGKGAFFNDRRIRVAARRTLADSVITCGIPHQGRGDLARFRREIERMQPEVAGLRRTGAASIDLAWVASGRFDGFWERDLSPWDMAAGIVILQEAGGFVTDLDGGPDMLTKGHIVIANPDLQPQILKLLKSA
ncbi:MAG: inositol monophosphatase [Xanthobacteraceae bacterium]|nr:inositol monophosphatase [Xanthobacteraceae bacterium]QYK44564.1 MAG: inositol monophosphatase [Xanthobacteraceae bacterium]